MKSSERKSSAGENDFLVGVARSIGSTLGAVVAKVSSTTAAVLPHPDPVRRKRATRKRVTRNYASAAVRSRKPPVRVSRKKSVAAGRASQKNRRKGPKKSLR